MATTETEAPIKLQMFTDAEGFITSADGAQAIFLHSDTAKLIDYVRETFDVPPHTRLDCYPEGRRGGDDEAPLYAYRVRTSKDFHITDAQAARWYLRKKGAFASERARVKANAKAILDEIDKDEAELDARYASEFELFAWENRNSGKSYKDVAGTAKFTHVNAAIKLVDKAAAEKYACALNPNEYDVDSLFVTTKALDGAAYRRFAESVLEQSGEIIPGVEMTEARESMSLSFGG